jgi:plasmid segregation protein ParM
VSLFLSRASEQQNPLFSLLFVVSNFLELSVTTGGIVRSFLVETSQVSYKFLQVLESSIKFLEGKKENMALKWYATGFDFGNGETDMVIIRGKELLMRRVPTAFVQSNLSEMRSLKGLNPSADEEEELKYMVQYADEPFCFSFGDLALAQGVQVWTGRGDEQRYTSHYALKAALITAASLIKDKEFGLYLVSGLPADTYIRSEILRTRIKNQFDGIHRFSIDGGKTWRTISIQVCTIIMEGAGALIAYGGDIQKTTESAVIDIGQQTTDLYAQMGNVPMREFCKNIHVGVETATQLVCDAFETKYAPRTLSALEAREVMRAYATGTSLKTRKYPKITVYGEPVPVTILDDFVTKSVTQAGGDIASFVASAWRQAGGAARFNPVLLIGGGFYYYSAILKERIKHLQSPEEPTYANAVGYAKLAEKQLKKRPPFSLKDFGSAHAATEASDEGEESAVSSDETVAS